MELPSKNQWWQFFKILTKKEKIVFFVFLFLFFGSSFFLAVNFYFENTEIKPAGGGQHIEGVVGSPRFINPAYAASDVDRDLVELIYSGLMKYNEEGKIVPDLAKEYKILEDGKVYEFYLKEKLFWSDGKPLTADDVIFTIKTIQNPEIKSPLRVNWLGVEVEKISLPEGSALRFSLKDSSAVFLENCTLKIMPEHIWKDISPSNFLLTIQNLKPIGSGPFQLKNLNRNEEGQIISLDLIRNPKYFKEGPNLSQITFYFFKNEEDLIKSYQKGEIKGLTLVSLENLNLQNGYNLYSLSLPRYFAVFFNPEKSKALSEKEIRRALNYGVNKEEILKEILDGRGKVVESPILPEIYGFQSPTVSYEFNPEKAKEILKSAGFVESGPGGYPGKLVKVIKKEPAFQLQSNLKLGSQGTEVKELQKCLARDPEIYPEGETTGYFGQKTKEAVIRFQEKYKKEILEPQGLEKGTGDVLKSTRTKLNEICFKSSEEVIPLELSLTTVNQPILKKVAELLKRQWETLRAKVEIKTVNSTNFTEEIIRPRDYEMLLFGEVLGAIPDPFPFWHSSQKKDPGLNLAIYENKKSDKLLEEVRESLDENLRMEKLEEFQDVLIGDAPAVFLYNPDYLYLVSKEIKGINTKIIVNPSKRFADIEDWYIKTKRAWK